MSSHLITIIFFIILYSTCSLPDCLAANTWQPIGPFGGAVKSLAVDPTNSQTLYAGTRGGLFKSTNGGASWTFSSNGIPTDTEVYSLLIDPTNSRTVYAGTSKGLFKSKDSGATWTAANNGIVPDQYGDIYVHSLAVDPTNSQSIYVGTEYGRVFKTTNSGESWQAVGSGITDDYIYSLTIDPTNSQTIYAGTYAGYGKTTSGIFKSIDGGVSWKPANSGIPSKPVYSIVIDPTNSQMLYAGAEGNVYKSTDGGASWTGTLKDAYVNTLAIDPANSQTLYAGLWLNGLYKSTDGGVTWQAANSGIVDDSVYSLAIDPGSDRTVYAGTFGIGIFKTTNGGASWQAANSGITNTTANSLTIDPTSSQTLYAGTTRGVDKSINGGISWTAANSGISSLGNNILAIDPTNSRTVYAGTDTYGLFKSSDGGASWTASNTGIDNFQGLVTITAIAIDPKNGQTLYAGTSDENQTGRHLYKSTNGGASWTTPSTDSKTDMFIDSIAIDPINSGTVYIGGSGGYQAAGLYKSTDGGSTWKAANTGIQNNTYLGPEVYTLAIDPTNSQKVYAGTDSGLFKSTNGGISWIAAMSGITSKEIQSLAIDPSNSQIVYAGSSDGGLFKSTNGGSSWTAELIGNTITNIYSLAINPSNSQIVYAATNIGIIKKLFSSSVPTLTPSSPAFTTGIPGTFQINSSGWPAPTFSLSGALPAGLSFNATTGTISGTPASGSAGTYPLLITATNGVPPDAVRGFTLTVLPASDLAVAITSPIKGSSSAALLSITGTASGSGLSGVEVQVTDGTYYLQCNGVSSCFGLTAAWLPAIVINSANWTYYTGRTAWNENITYTVQARATNGTTTSVPATSTFNLTTGKNSTNLTLDIPDSIRVGESATITGSLGISRLLSPVSINLRITPPATATNPNPTPTPIMIITSSGNFTTTVDSSLFKFSTPGVYTIQAYFSGNSTLAASFSSQALGVTPHSGYAIIVSGKATDNSLLDMHNNTTDSINSTMINKRGFLPGDINYLKSNTSTAVTKQQIQNAITVWAKGKLSATPAPLYIIMIDHGTQSGFVIGDQIVTPDELSGWLNTLETDPAVVSSALRTNYKRFVIIGSCYSGTFISKLSKTGRVIITSAGTDEQSLAGFSIYNSASNTTFSGGEYFIDTMINFLGRGDNFKDAVTQSSSNVALRDPRKLEPGNHSGVYDTLAQHPLLDDTGNKTASYLPANTTNGTVAADLTLGVGVKTLGNPADITAVTDTTFIQPTHSSDTPLWLSVNDNSRIAKAWMEIRTPVTAVDSSGGSGQVIPRLIVNPLYYDGLQWNGSYNFPNAGTYKILYYTQDNQTSDIAPAKNSTVYKQLSSNTAPSTFTLTSPSDQNGVSGMFPLTWQEVTSSNSLTYTLLVSTDQNFGTIVYKEERIPQAATYIADGKLKNPATGAYYCQSSNDTWCYWKVQAIDSFGATTESNRRSFTIIYTNALPSMLKGTVTDSNGPVSGAKISAGIYNFKTLTNGYYLLAVPSGNYTLSVSLGNQLQSKSITTTPGIVTTNDFILQSTLTQYTVIPSAGTGGTITPNTPQTVTSGATTTFTITPNNNYTATVVSDCGGTQQAGNTTTSYTTGAITSNCTVTAIFTLTAPTPIHGTCGSANNTLLTTIPTTNLCSSGTESTVTGTGPWSWSCSGSYGGTTANCSAGVKTPEVKVFMSSSTPEVFTVATSGTTLYGGSKLDVITINTGVSGVTLDQNVDRINLPGISGSYRFKQSGNLLKIYDENGTTLIVTIPVQGDSDGTQIGFSSGNSYIVYDAKLALGQLNIGGATVPSNSPQNVSPFTPTSKDESVLSTTSTAGIYLSNNDFTVSNSGARIFGSGSDALTIATGTDNITFDQNISQLNFNDAPSNYRLLQTGNMINVYRGATLIARGPVQANPGTKITFVNDGYGYLTISRGVMELNGYKINTTPTAIVDGVLKQ